MQLLKLLVTERLLDKNDVLNINKREAVRIIKYAQETYFRHLKLYEFVFNNKTASEIKRINFNQDEARKVAPLT